MSETNERLQDLKGNLGKLLGKRTKNEQIVKRAIKAYKRAQDNTVEGVKYLAVGMLLVLIMTTPALAADNPSPSIDDKYYTLDQYLVVRANNKNPIAVLKFLPAKGWKWNKQFPIKFKVKRNEAGKKPYSIRNEWIEPEKKGVQVWLELKPSVYAELWGRRFVVTAKYSFCTKTVCKTFKRDIKF
jgi:hypothetical protein